MGHEKQYVTYPESVNKKSVQSEWDAIVRQICWQEGASGLCSSIRWIDKICASYEEAEEYIKRHDNGWYDQLAVKYLDYSGVQPDKKLLELQKRVNILYEVYLQKANNIHYAGAKAKYITCKCCGSSISREHLRGNHCPVCKADMRPDSTQQRIVSAKASYENALCTLKAEQKKYQEKCKKQAKVRWLVKIEYHV